MTVQQKLGTRAVQRPIEAGSAASCASCGEPVKFTAKVRHWQVIANVYAHGKWNRVEHFHAECYEGAGEPYGSAPLPAGLSGRERENGLSGRERENGLSGRERENGLSGQQHDTGLRHRVAS